MQPKEVKIRQIIPLSPTVRTFVLPKLFDYKPGQFAVLFENINGEKTNRPYSFSSSPTESGMAVTIKLIPEGKMTQYIFRLKEGDILHMAGPFGEFIYDPGHKDIICIAGGSGIAPIRGMIRYIEDNRLSTKITLFFTARTPDDLLFKQEFDALQKKRKNFKVIYIVTRYEKWEGLKERISKELIEKNVGNPKRCHYYVCGPRPMQMGIKTALGQIGVPKENIKVDVWG